MKRLIFLCVLGLAGSAFAQEIAGAAEAIKDPHPAISSDSSWAGVMLIVIIGAFFLPAAVIGPIVRALAPQEVPLDAHDEPPGTSGHHGKSGTVDHNAPEKEHH
ncbi:MAG TPA: hypothetical protein VKK61_07655 [Tepidisphaeraceae bacterium]|nr:hypothetical protein [Tepidisphaeraceae bacterium]